MPQTTVQAVGQAAVSIIEGLRSNPMVLAIIILNVVFLVIAAWLVEKQNERRGEIVKLMLTSCFKERHDADR